MRRDGRYKNLRHILMTSQLMGSDFAWLICWISICILYLGGKGRDSDMDGVGKGYGTHGRDEYGMVGFVNLGK